jgi:hypothetical protein
MSAAAKSADGEFRYRLRRIDKVEHAINFAVA